MARAPFTIVVIDASGNVQAGASVEVRRRADNAVATVYSAETGSGTSPNPLTTDASGRTSGWLDRGAYKATVSGAGIVTYVENIDAAPASDGALDTAWMAASFLPIGAVMAYGGASDPSGGQWFICDGRALSRTTYAALFNALGTTFGAGDGSTTFNVPDLKGRFPMGAGTPASPAVTGGTAHALGSKGGEETHKLLAGESGLPAHNPAITDPGHVHDLQTVAMGGTPQIAIVGGGARLGGTQGAGGTDWIFQGAANGSFDWGIGVASHLTGITSSVAAADAASNHNNLPQFTAVNFIIRAL